MELREYLLCMLLAAVVAVVFTWISGIIVFVGIGCIFGVVATIRYAFSRDDP